MATEFVLDKHSVLDRLGGDEDLFKTLAEMFVQDADGYCDNLREALRIADPMKLQREAHTVKGLMATFSDNEGMELALSIEKQAKLGSVDALDAGVDQLVGLVLRLKGVLAEQ